MSATRYPAPARERILDAAASVIRDKGVANTTTKAIAAAAGYSEAMLYKHFADKQELFLLVLEERLPELAPAFADPGTGHLDVDLVTIVARLMDYFAELFPISVWIFSSPELLRKHRESVEGGGAWTPVGAIRMLDDYLVAERDAGRIRKSADTTSVARLLVGAAFQQGFLAAFEGRTTVHNASFLALGVVAAVLPALAG